MTINRNYIFNVLLVFLMSFLFLVNTSASAGTRLWAPKTIEVITKDKTNLNVNIKIVTGDDSKLKSLKKINHGKTLKATILRVHGKESGANRKVVISGTSLVGSLTIYLDKLVDVNRYEWKFFLPIKNKSSDQLQCVVYKSASVTNDAGTFKIILTVVKK